jgi:hypothetical protein
MKRITFILITPVFILLAHYLAVFPHEYAHSFTAWLLGYKSNPFALNYGGASISNILLLLNIDQAVDNKTIYSLGHPYHVAIIAASGMAINMLFYIVSFLLLNAKKIASYPYCGYFLLYFNLMNLGNIYDYVPMRTFSTHGSMVDILDIEQGLNLSPWLVYAIGGYLVAFLVWQFFTKTMITTYINLKINSTLSRAVLMIICVFILFGYFGLAGFINHGEISHFISLTSFLAIPGMIIVLWPTRNWVVRHRAQ